MQDLFRYSADRIAQSPLAFTRFLYDDIDWNQRLIGITGARGTGKTTLMLQHIKNSFNDPADALYISLDSFYFLTHTLFDLAENFYLNGGKSIYIDEVHRYPRWSTEIKNLYDQFPQLRIVFSGSSAIQIYKAEADLSRRASLYHLPALSFREYLALSGKFQHKPIFLKDILENHIAISSVISRNIKPIPAFKDFLKQGAYPFFIESGSKFTEHLTAVINVIIEVDLLSIENFTYTTLTKIKKILTLIADSVPCKPNISELSRKTAISRDILLRILDLLERSDLLFLLRQNSVPTGYLTKPEKIYLNNTSLFQALTFSNTPETETIRETFFASQFRQRHRLSSTTSGDFLIDGRFTFEIGGRNKKNLQIRGINESFLVSDDIETGYKNQIPLWLFGFLY
jgi:predicted AAA+ superfamily ATPase